MSKHKWHKEIKAWADGAEIEAKWKGEKEWWDDDDPEWGNDDCIFRLKPQLVGTQYLYVYVDELWNAKLKGRDELFKGEFGNYIGKIPLMVDSNDANQTEQGFFEQELTEKEKASIQFELTLPAVRELLDLKPLQEPTAFCKHGVPKGVCTLGEKDCNKPGWNSLSKIEIMELFKVYPSDPGFHMLCDQVKLIDDKLKEKNT